MRLRSFVLVALLLIPQFSAAQTVTEPAVPADPLELITGDAQPVQDVAQRADVINRLMNARRISDVRAYSYDLKTQFTVFGSSGSDGSWQLEDTVGDGQYRWTAQGPGYSAVNLYSGGILYSNQAATGVPLRLAQVRAAIFFVQPMLGPRAVLRTASASLNGSELLCALVSHGEVPKNALGGRRWEEAEYCVDRQTGYLVTYSPVPGMYVLYAYSKALHLQDKVIANGFTITQGGRTIIEAQTESVTAAPEESTPFQPAGLNSIGVGWMMTAPWRFDMPVPTQSGGASSSVQMVVVHGMQAPNGSLSDLELICSTDSSLNGAALQFAAQFQAAGIGGEMAQGATPQSHELILSLEFGRVPVRQ